MLKVLFTDICLRNNNGIYKHSLNIKYFVLVLEKEASYQLTCIVEVAEIKMHAEYKYIYFVLEYINILSHFLYAQTYSWCYCDSPVDTYVIIIQCVTPSAL